MCLNESTQLHSQHIPSAHRRPAASPPLSIPEPAALTLCSTPATAPVTAPRLRRLSYLAGRCCFQKKWREYASAPTPHICIARVCKGVQVRPQQSDAISLVVANSDWLPHAVCMCRPLCLFRVMFVSCAYPFPSCSRFPHATAGVLQLTSLGANGSLDRCPSPTQVAII